MSFIETRKERIARNKCICGSESTGSKITQPDLSRTVRQILRDTVEGRPSPTELPPQEFSSDVYKTTDPEKLHNLREFSQDKLEAIDQSREKSKELREVASMKQKQLKNAENQRLKNIQEQKNNELRNLRKEVSELRNLSSKRTE